MRAAVVAGLAFLVLATAFNALDLYRNLFYSLDHFNHLSYNVARFVISIFLLEIQFALGQAPLALLRRRGARFLLAPEEELAISILCGSAIMRAIMLLLGFAGLYYWWLIAIGGAALAMVGWDRFADLWRSFATARWAGIRASGWVERLSMAGTFMALIVAVTEVVELKLIFPNGPYGTGDFYTHYFPYMQHAVAAHNIWPNEVWYHFFVSKALGEAFFAILVTDPLGVQIASCSMFLVALLIMFCFVHRAANDPFVALAATAATAIGFIWTSDPIYGFWADFPKEHVITATLWFGCIWAGWRGRSIDAKNRNAWSLLVAIAFCGLIVVRVQFAATAVIFLAAMIAWEGISRRGDLVRAYTAQLGAVVAATIFALALNYAVMGVAELTPFRLFWSFADQSRFAHWVSPFLMLVLQLGSSPDFGSLKVPDWHALSVLTLFVAMARLDRAAPFMGPWGATFIVVLGLATLGLLRRKVPNARTILSASAALLLMLGVAATAVLASNQYTSMYRLFMFCMFPVIALAAFPFVVARSAMIGRGAAAIAAVLTIQLLVAVQHEIAAVPNGGFVARFALGEMSLADGLAAGGAMWPEGLAMSRAVGAGTPIWTSEVGQDYCAAPECSLETFFSFSMGPEWHTIMFAPPAAAKAALQRAGINFFAFDTSVPLFDTLPYAPLFAPAEIRRRFGIAWSGGGVYVLTWRSGSTTPIPEGFFPAYAASKAMGLQSADFATMHSILDGVYKKWKSGGEKWPVRLDPSVPLPRGWQ